MIKTQSQNEEIIQITQVWWRVCDKAGNEVRGKVWNEVWWKVSHMVWKKVRDKARDD
jgi:hypothetical protein